MRLSHLITTSLLAGALTAAQIAVMPGVANHYPPSLGWTHFWPFTESTGTIAYDIVGGLNATFGSPGPAWQKGAGLLFDGVQTTGLSFASPHITTAFTVVIGFSGISPGGEILSGEGGSPFTGFAIKVTNYKPQFYVNGTGWVAVCTTAISTGNAGSHWRYTFTLSGTTVSCYQNGVLNGTAAMALPGDFTHTVNVGYQATTSIDYLGFASGVWTQAQVTQFDNWAAGEYARTKPYPAQPIIFPPNPTTVSCTGGCTTPVMGWMSWLLYGNGASSTLANYKTQCAGLNTLGLAAAGYNYCNLNLPGGSPGIIGLDKTSVPYYPALSASSGASGVSSAASYIHGIGLKFGAYMNPGQNGCLSDLGMEGNEAAIALGLANAGVDLLYVDWCNTSTLYSSQITTYGQPAVARQVYQTITQALSSAGKTMAVDMNYANTDYLSTANLIGASIGRWHGDVTPYNWTGIQTKYTNAINAGTSTFGAGFYPDPDPLFCGLWSTSSPAVTNHGAAATVSDAECRSEIGLYVITMATMQLAADLTGTGGTNQLDSTMLANLTNADVIAANQDSAHHMGMQASSVSCGTGTCQVWMRQLSGTNTWVLLFENQDVSAESISITWSALHAANAAFANMSYTTNKTLWDGANPGTLATGYTAASIPSHDCVLLRVAP